MQIETIITTNKQPLETKGKPAISRFRLSTNCGHGGNWFSSKFCLRKSSCYHRRRV